MKQAKFERAGGKESENNGNIQEVIPTAKLEQSILVPEENKINELPLANNNVKNKDVENEINRVVKELPGKYADNTKGRNIKPVSEKKMDAKYAYRKCIIQFC